MPRKKHESKKLTQLIGFNATKQQKKELEKKAEKDCQFQLILEGYY